MFYLEFLIFALLHIVLSFTNLLFSDTIVNSVFFSHNHTHVYRALSSLYFRLELEIKVWAIRLLHVPQMSVNLGVICIVFTIRGQNSYLESYRCHRQIFK